MGFFSPEFLQAAFTWREHLFQMVFDDTQAAGAKAVMHNTEVQ